MQISYIKNAPKFLVTGRPIGRVVRVTKFKYLGEITEENGLEKFVIEGSIHEVQIRCN